MRSSVLTAKCVGTSDTIAHQCRLQPGDTQHMVFQATDSPPFLDPSAPQYDRPMTAAERAAHDRKKVTAAERKRKKSAAENSMGDDEEEQDEDDEQLDADQQESQQNLGELTANAAPTDEYTRVGYVGKPKGIYQILWERGLYVKNMVKSHTEKSRKACIDKGQPMPDEALDASQVLAACEDFQKEVCVLQDLLHSRE